MKRLLVLSLLLAGCPPEYQIEPEKEEPEKVTGIIQVEPQVLEFQAASEGDPGLEQFAIRNVGNAALDVSSILVVDNPVSFTLLSDSRGLLEPGQVVDVEVQYTPLDFEETGLIEILSDASNESRSYVDLIGRRVPGLLELAPDPYVFGEVPMGATVEGSVTITNVGIGPVEVSYVQTDGPGFDVVNVDSFPKILAAGASAPVRVAFTPEIPGDVTGELIVTNNGEETPVSGALTGYGVEPPLPIAVCSVNPVEVEPLYQTATFYGSESYDPSGLSITGYQWTLKVRPAGSAAILQQGNAPNRIFTPDLAGQYQAELIVTNEIGLQSEPCVTQLEVVPSQDLWIEMFWTHSGDDMDLHLLRPGGGLNSAGDCYYANCTYFGLDWGILGNYLDDPILDLDDIPGTGPENINIIMPQDGVYTVAVHDYPGSVNNTSNDTTVNIYISGALVWSDTRPITVENSFTYYAEIDWATRTVTGL